MPTWNELGAQNAREENERMRQAANARASVGPINEVNETLKEIKALLIEIRNAINSRSIITEPSPLSRPSLMHVPPKASALDQALDL
jgi:hypothetical protein